MGFDADELDFVMLSSGHRWPRVPRKQGPKTQSI